jgi:hypothetical protein
MPQITFGKWTGPVEVVNGIWGKDDREFGVESGDISDRLPWLTAVLYDGKIVISDQVNGREIIYNSSGTLFKVVPSRIQSGAERIVNPEYPLYQYWNVQGYTTEGNVWIKKRKYLLKSATGQIIKTSTERPAELGIVQEKSLGSGKYKVTITYPDKIYTLNKGPFSKYIRDNLGYINAIAGKSVEKFSYCGKSVDELLLPADKSKVMRPGGGGFEELSQVIVQYGEPVIASNGDVYTWKRTRDEYSILRWIWVDDPKAVKESCPEQQSVVR